MEWHTRRLDHEGSRLFAVIKTGGKQYCVAAGDTISVMTLAGNPGDRVTFDRVLMLSQDGEPALGTPFIDGASVRGQIVEHTRGPKAIAFKKRRRKNSKRKRGHRQDLTLARITEVIGGVELSVATAPLE
jgi:large subunit ribosomal protein L21